MPESGFLFVCVSLHCFHIFANELHEDDGANGSRLRREDLGNPGKRLSVSDVRALLHADNVKPKSNEGKQSEIAKRVENALFVVQKLLQDEGGLGHFRDIFAGSQGVLRAS